MDARNGPGSLYWIVAGGAGWLIITVLSLTAGIVPSSAPLVGVLFGVSCGIHVAVLIDAARQPRRRGWLALISIIAVVLTAWVAFLAVDAYEQSQINRPHSLF